MVNIKMKGGNNMTNTKLIVGVLIVVALVIGGYLMFFTGPTVSAQGISTVDVMPDKASVYVSAEGRAATAQDAQKKANDISDATVIALIKAGINQNDIKLQSMNVYEDFDWISGGRKSKGFIASQQLVVNVKDFSKIAAVVDSGIESGSLINSVQFELSQEKQNEYKRQALEEASKDAKAKAESIASGSGRNVGRLVSISSSEFNYGPMYAYNTKAEAGAADISVANAEARSAVANISPSDLTVSATVSAEYRLSMF